MSNAIAVLPIRLLCDLAARNGPLIDVNTGQAAVFYRGDDVEIDIGIGEGGALLPPTLSNITSVTCQVFAKQNDTNAPMMSCTVLAASMNLALTASQNYWLRITLLTADVVPKVITLLDGPVTVLDGPVSAASPALGNARFTTDANGNWVLQIRNDSDGKFYTVGIENGVGGTPGLYLGDTGY